MCIPTIPSSQQVASAESLRLVNKLGMKRPRAVGFSDDVATISSESKSCDEIHASWYQSSELQQFKLEARNYILSVEGVEDVRGLERYTLERSQGKQIAIRCTLLAYHSGMNEDAVCQVARQCSAWFQERAFVQGCEDYCHVYYPDLIDLVPQCSSNPSQGDMGFDNCSNLSLNKRVAAEQLSEDGLEQRRVRIRTI